MPSSVELSRCPCRCGCFACSTRAATELGLAAFALAAIKHLQAAEQACRSELWLNPTCSWSAGKPRILQHRFQPWEAANASPNKVLRSGDKRRSRPGELAV